MAEQGAIPVAEPLKQDGEAVAGLQIAIEHHAAELILDDADPWSGLTVEHGDQVVAE